MASQWRNWARDQACRPAAIETPGSRAELVEVLERAASAGLPVRASASGHSFTDVALTDGVMVRCDRLGRILAVDRASGLVKVEAGIVLGDLNRRLDELGLAFENLGDIDRQTLAGAISTGTHGTGARFRSISAQVEAVDLVLADGSSLEISAMGDRAALDAARIGLGALGLIYAVTVRTVPAYTIERVDSPRPLAEALARLDELDHGSDHFELYVFPHTEVALCRESRRTDDPPRPRSPARVYAQEVILENWAGGLLVEAGLRLPALTPRLARLAAAVTGRSTTIDRSFRVFASDRRIRFTEMEYAIGREHAAEAVRRVLEVAARPEHRVAFPIEVRFAAADELMLSGAHGRDTCYVSVHQDRRLDWEPYFRAVEAIMDSYEGRPHWGKRHFQAAATLAPRYPRWDEFAAVRDRLDPGRRFTNAYIKRVLG
ncbi:MAG: FAD-binding protein [Solirubrobacterales bacterium]|nr:FAD-binding protein [Solirubrobacterales bacterium]